MKSKIKRTPGAGLPGVLPLLKETLGLYKTHLQSLTGYLAWLLFPLVLTVIFFLGVMGVTEVSESGRALFDFLINGLLLTLLILWCMTIIVLLVPSWRAKKQLKGDVLGRIAWHFTPTVVYISLIVCVLSVGGLLLLIIPGILLSVWFSFATITAVLEQKTVFASMKRSKELVRGKFMQILWRQYAGGFLILTLYLVLYVAILSAAWGLDPAAFLSAEKPPLFAEILLRIFEIIIFPIGVIYQTILYLEVLKLEKTK